MHWHAIPTHYPWYTQSGSLIQILGGVVAIALAVIVLLPVRYLERLKNYQELTLILCLILSFTPLIPDILRTHWTPIVDILPIPGLRRGLWLKPGELYRERWQCWRASTQNHLRLAPQGPLTPIAKARGPS